MPSAPKMAVDIATVCDIKIYNPIVPLRSLYPN